MRKKLANQFKRKLIAKRLEELHNLSRVKEKEIQRLRDSDSVGGQIKS